jgi:tetratricopeptide (TPR) repeat protein
MGFRVLTCAALLLQAATVSAADAESSKVEQLKAHLARARSSTDDQRHAVLTEIGAEVPDAKGRFTTPQRDPNENKPETELDWLAALRQRPASPVVDEVISDVEAIRGLAETQEFAAGAVILDFAFSGPGLVYRDECGRYLRKMSPYSLPALIRTSQSSRNASKARYARYQLERLDRELPFKALGNAPTDAVRIAILQAYRDVHHREAVPAVLKMVDDVAPAVRAAARETWMSYVLGPPPPEPPKKKLQLPGGKLTKEEVPLFLNYRQFAEVEIRRELERLTGSKPNRRATLKELSQQLFAFYDQRRLAARDDSFARALELAEQEKYEEAAALFDRVLVADPNYLRRAETAPTFLALAKLYENRKKWDAAAAAYSKAHAVAPDAPTAEAALAGQHNALGHAPQAEGEDGTAAFERERSADPPHEAARAVADDSQQSAAPAPAVRRARRPTWMIYVGALAACIALALMLLAVRRRQA